MSARETQLFLIRGAMIAHCGASLTPQRIETIVAELDHQMRHGGCAWAFVTAEGGAGLIASERRRQVDEEKFSSSHDDEHKLGQLTDAAMCFNLAADGMSLKGWTVDRARTEMLAFCWPWEPQWCKPAETAQGNYVKAGALIAAEIDRLKRAAAKGGAK